ncbi:ABC transporter permease subunit [Eubacterium sp. 1001713B170207_170306_E7]|uniref:ABC transporter permease subunit n=1 Tax=Eubacterium sp. 1001713B170207_170306_E7 TaxID=2787097 RepID=UPI001896BBC8|nr:ABC transporter permease subunit [Eubacterium sp. 1001713B170207_170306_E7]
MLSWPLFKKTFKSQLKMLIIFAAILAMYMSVEISMFNPDSMDGIQQMMDMLPQQMISAMNLDVSAETSLVGFLGSYFYGFIVIMVPMIFNIIASNNAAAKLVDSGAMACLLSAPNSRTKVIFTQALSLILSNIILMTFVTVMGIVVSQALFPGDLDIRAFLLVNAGALLMQLAVSAIGFFASCLFNESRFSLALGGGLPVLFLVLMMLSGVSEDLDAVRYTTMYSLFDPAEIIAGGDTVGLCLAGLAAIFVVLYALGILVFRRKDLPL